MKKAILRKTQNRVEFRFFAKFVFAQIDKGHFKVYLSMKTKNRVFRHRDLENPVFKDQNMKENVFFADR